MAVTGRLLIVGTPIGNLEDASFRALSALSEADVILCEDTRVSSKLLARFDIHVKLERADENVLRARIPRILERINAGETIALVSDAGMPAISDPGQALVDAALDAGVDVSVVPGPSAVTCALALSGLDSRRFFFEGFLPRKVVARGEELAMLARVPATIVIYESPKRVSSTLANIAECMPTRRVALVRELTKLHEEVLRGLPEELVSLLDAREPLRGECVIVVEGPSCEETRTALLRDVGDLDEAIREGLGAGEATSALAKRLSSSFPQSRKDIYSRILELSELD